MRKADKCISYKPVNKVKDRNIICPYCNSHKVWLNGTKSNSIRYQCQNCLKGFSIKTLYL